MPLGTGIWRAGPYVLPLREWGFYRRVTRFRLCEQTFKQTEICLGPFLFKQRELL